MGFVEGKCTKCQGGLSIPEDLDSIICMYCGERIDAADAIANVKDRNIQKDADQSNFRRNYNMAMEHMADLMVPNRNVLEHFKREKYPSAFQSFYKENIDTLTAVEEAFRASEEQSGFIRELASVLVTKADTDLKALGKKRKQEEKLIDYNLSLVVYTIPALLEYKGTSGDLLADEIIRQWGETFPKTNIGKSTFQQINGGFRRKLCYITTAVCESLGKPDDCYELNLLRNYRDCYLVEQEGGDEIVKEYYDIAPTIVKRINKSQDFKKIYYQVWKDYLSPCVHLIEEGKNDECRLIYAKMVKDLRVKYIYS